MFKLNDGYFESIVCPEIKDGKNCGLINCVFKHSNDEDNNDSDRQSKRPSPDSSNELKRRRVDEVSHSETVQTDDKKDVLMILPKAITHINIPRPTRSKNTKEIAKIIKSNTPNKAALAKEYEICQNSKSIEDYNKAIELYLQPKQVELVDPELILPKELTSPPATIQVRKQNILLLVEALKQMQPELKHPKLTAIEKEATIAMETSKSTYMQTFKRKVYEIKNPGKVKTAKKDLTNEDYYKGLLGNLIPRDKLKKYGYIMDIPEAIEPSEKRVCRRCNVEFYLKDQLVPTHCMYHSRKSTKRNRERVYECCGSVVGDNESEACTSSSYHVFYWSNPEEMQHFLPFKETQKMFPKNKYALKALGIDCEMGFTTKGFELLRITAIDFFTGEEAIDLLVRPKGEVIDLNTQWSGIAEIKDEAISFEQLIELLGEIMDENTVLIGHGLENDMNAMRLIHNKIVDTAVLFPRNKTSPTFRYSLKNLTFTYLSKNIQTGQHDSGEDSLAAIDIVKYFIKKESNFN